MHVRSLGYRTDLIFAAFDGEITDRGDYLVIRTPAHPTFFWGNYLLFARPPQEGDLDRWRALFEREIGAPPETAHQVFGWDSPDGETGVVEPFLRAGFRLVRNTVLASREPRRPARPLAQVTVRALQSEDDWTQALENQVACREPEFREGEYRTFKKRQFGHYRQMAAAGHGDWYGAFIEERLVGDLGLFHNGNVGRYQSVGTHPDYRRRGVAGTLVYEAGRRAQAEYRLERLVIVAKAGSAAARLYGSMGFRPAELQVGLEWWPQIGAEAGEGG